jgi:hypothetical protein
MNPSLIFERYPEFLGKPGLIRKAGNPSSNIFVFDSIET